LACSEAQAHASQGMKIEVTFTPAMIDASGDVRGRTVVVIDTLRATSTIITALMAGAREVIPVASPGDAVSVAQRLGVDRTLLCGERGALRIDGFRLGNSPREYTPEVVGGKTLVLATTNGTAALLAAQPAASVLCGALLNARAVAEEIIASPARDVVIICAGTHGRFSIEDTLAAGAIIEAVTEFATSAVAVDDGGRASLLLFRNARNDLGSALRDGDHGATLEALGLGEDIDVCARLDIEAAIVPALVGSTIRLAEVRESR
jgi:2-phosphosulfolactate phosphatase